MKRKIYTLTILCLSIAISLPAQLDIKIGQWKSYLPYQTGFYVAQSESSVFYTTRFGLLEIDKESREVTRFSKVEGLSEAGMGIIKYDPFNNVLITTYLNRNLDLIKEDGSIVNLPFIKTSDIPGDKEIVDIFIDSDTTAYFAMGFGLKILNVRDQEFGAETRTGMRFNGVVTHEGYLYATTEEGIYRVFISDDINIQDFSVWEFLGTAEGFPVDYSAGSIATFGGNLLIDIDEVLYKYENGNLQMLREDPGFNINYLTTDGPNLMMGLRCNEACNGKAFLLNENGSVVSSISTFTDCINRPNYGLQDTQGRLFFADDWDGYRISESTTDVNCNKFTINSPFFYTAGEITLDGDNIWLASEVIASGAQFNDRGMFTLIEGDWKVFNKNTNPEIGSNRAFYRIAIHPENKKVYVGTRWDGLIEFDPETEEMEVFTVGNSTLKPSADPNRVRVTGMVFDQDNNLWMSNHTANNRAISVLKNDGTFTDNFKELGRKELRQMIIDNNNYIWIATDEGGVYVYDFNGTIDDSSDDQFKLITSACSQLPSNRVNSLAMDLDGNVWVGTSAGAIVFDCQQAIFEPGCCQGTIPKVDVNGILGLLLDTEVIKTIAVDGANRKWFGTENGIFVQSPNGTERLAAFDVNNSPLFNNVINDIAINNSTGEVFIATGQGLMSLRTDALGADNFHDSQIYAYPNPVRPEYDGPIAIKGFARDSNIKITDINGQLIFETQALGGQAIWDGRDYNGRKASSGVYLVFATRTSNRDQPDAVVTKILLIN